MIPSTSVGTKPRVILGLMTFGPPGTEAKGARITDLSAYKECLTTLSSNAYLELDTARVYISGDQEAFTKQAGYESQGFSIATKVYPYEAGVHSPAKLRAHFEKSLAELGTKCVDIFYLHAPDRSVPFAETLQTCNDMHKEGKFVRLGLSNFAAWEVAEVVTIARERGWVVPSVYQAMYNAITRNIETELVPCCRKYGIDIVVYNPIAGGLFSGKFSTTAVADTPTEGRFSATNDRQGKMYRDRYFKDDTFKALAVIEPVVQKAGLTLVETALRWVVHHSALKMGTSMGPATSSGGGNDGIIIGVSSLQQLQGNLKDLEKGPLPEEVVKALDEAWMVNKASSPLYWRADPPRRQKSRTSSVRRTAAAAKAKATTKKITASL